MQRRLGSLASSLNKQVQQLSKGVQQIAHNIVLLQKEQARMQSAIKELIKRKTCKRRYVQAEGTLTVSKVSNLITKKEGSSYKDSKTPAKRVCAERRCSCCSEIRYNSCTYKVEIENVDNSTTSK
jgi:maltooligosyltrehalose synthase